MKRPVLAANWKMNNGPTAAKTFMDAFLASYRETTANHRFWPAGPTAAGQILNFFLLEKAFYEVEYELSHRPDWLRVLLTGIIRILSQQPDAAA